jgi:pyruvate/2-oxoglutarate dehydrogenase complex dihydrolipoamide dehydrogenase (E3) component
VVIERKYVGGSCPNIACLPSKNNGTGDGYRTLRWPEDPRSRASRRRDPYSPWQKCCHQYRHRASVEPIPGLAEAKPLTHIEALELDHIPKHLLILGAGYVGLELAQAFRRFGAEATLIDRNSRLAHHEDEDVSRGLEEMCRDEGINVGHNPGRGI